MRDPANVGKTGLGRRLAVLRTALGLEQKDVALRARVAPGAVSEIEQEKRNPEPETQDRLLEALRGSPANVQRAEALGRRDAGGPRRVVWPAAWLCSTGRWSRPAVRQSAWCAGRRAWPIGWRRPVSWLSSGPA